MRTPWDKETLFPRLGYLYEHVEQERPDVPALLHFDQESGLHLQIPFTMGSETTAGRWFGPEAQPCPERLLFQDHELNLQLFGVFVSTAGHHPEFSPGIGSLRAEFAVEDRDRSETDYERVQAMRSEIDGLHEFMGWQIAEFDSAREGAGETAIQVVRRETVVVGRVNGFDVELRAAWWAGRDRPNVQAVAETTSLVTKCDTPRPIEEHFRLHESVRDFVAIVCWKPTDFISVEVQREDGPALTLAATRAGPAWRPMHSSHLRRRAASEPAPEVGWIDTRTPFNFQSIQAAGLHHWLLHQREWARVTDPLISLRFTPVIGAHLALMQTSIAVEALAFRLAKQAGATTREAKDEKYKRRLERVLNAQPLDVAEVAGNREAWVRAAATAYNGVKHANRALPVPPRPNLLALTLTVVLRSNILCALGVPESVVKKITEHQAWWGLDEAYGSVKDWPTRESGDH